MKKEKTLLDYYEDYDRRGKGTVLKDGRIAYHTYTKEGREYVKNN